MSISMYKFLNIFIYIYIYIMPYEVKIGKQKLRRFSYIRLSFAHRANGSLSFVVCLRRNKRKSSVCDRTQQTCPSRQKLYVS